MGTSQLSATPQTTLVEVSTSTFGVPDTHGEDYQVHDLPTDPDPPPEDDEFNMITEEDALHGWNQDSHHDSTPEQESHIIGIKEDG